MATKPATGRTQPRGRWVASRNHSVSIQASAAAPSRVVTRTPGGQGAELKALPGVESEQPPKAWRPPLRQRQIVRRQGCCRIRAVADEPGRRPVRDAGADVDDRASGKSRAPDWSQPPRPTQWRAGHR